MEVGSRVVCVDSSKSPHTVEELNVDVPNWVRDGQMYTVRQIVEHDFGAVGVLLEEIRNPIRYFKIVDMAMEPMFAVWRFRECEDIELYSIKESLHEM